MEYPPFYDAADELSTTGQRRYMGAVRIRLFALAAAALGGAVTFVALGVDWLGWLALLAFLVAIACEVYILTAKPDEHWYEGRAAAESAKTLTWRYAVCGDPLPAKIGEEEARRRFSDQLRSITADLDHLSAVPVVDKEGIPEVLESMRARSFSARQELYVEGRLKDQISWYTRKASENAALQQKFLLLTVALEFSGVAGAALRIGGIIQFDALGIIAAVAAGFASWAQTRQYGQLSRAYSIAANELSIILSEVRSIPEVEWSRFVDEAEEAISREHTLWRASRGVLPRRR